LTRHRRADTFIPLLHSVEAVRSRFPARASSLLVGVYFSLDQSLGAAQAVAQWARWKTANKPGLAQMPQETIVRRCRADVIHPLSRSLFKDVHSSTQSSLASPSLSCCCTRSTQSSKWCLTEAHWAEFLHSAGKKGQFKLSPYDSSTAWGH
jgi:hypothetical protein